MMLDKDDLDTILICIKNDQPGRITPYELRELLRVWELAGHAERGTVEEMVHFYAASQLVR